MARHIKYYDPDVFGLLEMRDKAAVRALINEHFRGYDFALTDAKRTLDILVGWRRGSFQQTFFTQRRRFNVGNLNLRPGALFTGKLRGTFYNLLFLHTDSGRNRRDYDNRQEMFSRVWKLKKRLDEISGGAGRGRLIVLGDLNTMGRRHPAVTGDQEIERLRRAAKQRGMRMLPKDYVHTFKNPTGRYLSDLDHVLATRNTNFLTLDPSTRGQVLVDGWNQYVAGSPAERRFIEDVSDHCSIYGVVS